MAIPGKQKFESMFDPGKQNMEKNITFFINTIEELTCAKYCSTFRK